MMLWSIINCLPGKCFGYPCVTYSFLTDEVFSVCVEIQPLSAHSLCARVVCPLQCMKHIVREK